jgi:hypothetical protein
VVRNLATSGGSLIVGGGPSPQPEVASTAVTRDQQASRRPGMMPLKGEPPRWARVGHSSDVNRSRATLRRRPQEFMLGNDITVARPIEQYLGDIAGLGHRRHFRVPS